MTTTQTVKKYGESAVASGRSVAERLAEGYKTSFLAAVGAGDLAVERTRTVVDQFRSRAQALPGEAQVQADLAGKEARTRLTEAAGRARTRAQELATTARPAHAFQAVVGVLEAAQKEAEQRVEALAERGGHVVDDLRRQPMLRRIARRTEGAVESVEGRVEEALDATSQKVSDASDEVTSFAQKSAARTAKATDKAETGTREAAESIKERVDAATEPEPAEATARKAPPRTTLPAAEKAPTKATTARVTRARTARRSDPTVPPKQA